MKRFVCVTLPVGGRYPLGVLALGLLWCSLAYGQAAPTSAPTSGPFIVEEPTQKEALAPNAKLANGLLLASVAGKLVGLSFGAISLQRAVLANNVIEIEPIDLKTPRIATSIGWGFAAVMGGAAYVVDDTQVKPWMFYTETISYGLIGLGLGALALRAEDNNPDTDPQNLNPRLLGTRSAIFVSASASAGLAAYFLKKMKATESAP